MTTEVLKVSRRILHDEIVNCLGLNIGVGPAPKKSTDDTKEGLEGTAKEESVPRYHPLICLIGRPEMVKELIEQENKEHKSSNALEDTGLDALSEQLSNIDMGDLEPIFTGQNSKDPFERWMSEAQQELLSDVGVEQKAEVDEWEDLG